MSKHMLEDPNDNYMSFKDITLKTPLSSVKRTEKKERYTDYSGQLTADHQPVLRS